jgi:hypothetical protein
MNSSFSIAGPALEERDGVKLAVSNSTLYRRVTLPVLGPRRPK